VTLGGTIRTTNHVDMKPTRLFGLLIAVTSLTAAGCGSSKSSPHIFGDSASEIRVKVGDDFVIELDSNATTGYTWQFDSRLNSAVMTLVEQRYVAPKDSGKVGAGGTQRFTLHATGAGTATTRLVYVRPWEQPLVPAREKSYSITVT
jgi:inhibitor of cysteine peptidase